MPDFTNIVTVDLTEATGYNVEAHRAVHQWDSGVILQLTGATFPQGTTCQFDTKTTTFNQELTDGACEIPNALLGYDMIGDIKAHVKIDDDDYGIVVYDIHIPVIRRPKPDSYIYTDNSSSSNGWVKSRYGYRVNEDQTILGRTELSINDNQTILDGTSLSLNNQQTVLDGTHLSLASGLFYADATHLQLNSGRITIGPTQLLVDSRVFGTINHIDTGGFEVGGIDTTSGENYAQPNALRSKGFIKVKPSTTYVISKVAPSGEFSIRYYNIYGNFISTSGGGVVIFNTPSGCEYIRVEIWVGRAVSPMECVNIQLEQGSVVSPFNPYALDVVELTNRNAVQEWRSRNIWDPNILFAQGAFGEATPSQDRIYNPIFQQVQPGAIYTLSFKFNVENVVHGYFVWFDYWKNYISSSEASLSSSPYTFQVPSGVNYFTVIFVRVGSPNTLTPSNVVFVQLEEGPNASVYSDYALDNIALTNRRFVQDWTSKNIIDLGSVVQGGIGADGKEFPNSCYLRTPFISIVGNSAYTLSGVYSSGVHPDYVWEYNYSKQCTRFAVYTPSFITRPESAYVRFRWTLDESTPIDSSTISYLQLEPGSTGSPYVPFALDNIGLTNTTNDLLRNSRTFFVTANTSTTGQWFVILAKRLPQTSSWQAMISIRTPLYEYTPGIPRTFLVESFYGDIRLSPLSSTDVADDDWVDLLRITRNDNSMYVEGRILPGITGSTSNDFAITVTDLSGQYGMQYVVPSGFQGTSATIEIRTYTMSKKVNRLLNKGDMFFNRGGGTYNYSITSQPSTYFTLQIFGYVGNLGAVNLSMTCNGGSINVYDNMTNNTFENNQISFAYNSSTGVLSIWSYMGYSLFILGL